MWSSRAGTAIVMLALAGCTGSPAAVHTTSVASQPSTPSGSAAAMPACPITKHAAASLLGEPIEHVEGATTGSDEQVCAFSTSSTDVGALGVVYLRFPRPELEAGTLAAARRKYGSALSGHTVVSMPSWGPEAFLDETVSHHRNLVADFAWVPGFEVILGMHADDRQVPDRRRLIDRLVAATR